MANLYDCEYQRQEISFLDKMIEAGYCYIVGANFSNGEPRSENGLEAVSCFVDRGKNRDFIRRISFNRNRGGEGYFMKRIVFDKNSDLVFEIDPSLVQVDVFKNVETAKLNWGLHSREVARQKQVFFYDGCLQDVLLEFKQRGYGFNLWDINWDVGYFEGNSIAEDLDDVQVREVSVDKIVSMVSQEV